MHSIVKSMEFRFIIHMVFFLYKYILVFVMWRMKTFLFFAQPIQIKRMNIEHILNNFIEHR